MNGWETLPDESQTFDYIKYKFVHVRLAIKCNGPHPSVWIYGIRNASVYSLCLVRLEIRRIAHNVFNSHAV